MASTRVVRKVAVSIVGGIVLAVGVALLVLPGPGAVVILLGLLILGSEYDWAAKRLDTAKDKVLDSADNAARSPVQLTVSILGVLGLVAAGIAWGTWDALPFHGWTTGVTLLVSAVLAAATLGYSIWRVRSGAADRTPDQTVG